MVIFWRLVLAHLLTDYTLQFNFIARWKSKNISGVFVHAFIFLIIGAIFTRKYLFDTWVRFPGWVCLLVIFFVHFVEDYYRSASIRKESTPDNIVFFLWDQFIHLILIYLFSPTNNEEMFKSERTVIFLIILIIITHFTSILIYYIEQLVHGEMDTSLRLKYKYFLILERLVIFICLLFPGLLWLITIPVWFIYRVIQKKLNLNYTPLNIVTGTILTVMCALITRIYILPISGKEIISLFL